MGLVGGGLRRSFWVIVSSPFKENVTDCSTRRKTQGSPTHSNTDLNGAQTPSKCQAVENGIRKIRTRRNTDADPVSASLPKDTSTTCPCPARLPSDPPESPIPWGGAPFDPISCCLCRMAFFASLALGACCRTIQRSRAHFRQTRGRDGKSAVLAGEEKFKAVITRFSLQRFFLLPIGCVSGCGYQSTPASRSTALG